MIEVDLSVVQPVIHVCFKFCFDVAVPFPARSVSRVSRKLAAEFITPFLAREHSERERTVVYSETASLDLRLIKNGE